jgi:hypothetical protein
VSARGPLVANLAGLLPDLAAFGGFVDIATEDEGIVSFGWDRWWPEQRAFEYQRTGRDLVVKPRQLGFSMLELARDLQFARTHEGARVVVVVHTEDAKRKLFARVRLMERTLRERWGLTPEPNEDTTTSLSWADNRSSIEIIEAGMNPTTADKRGRSGTIHHLHCTEVAYYAAAAETMAGLLNAVGNRSRVIESTANGTTGIGRYFYEQAVAARDGDSGYKLHFYPWYEHARYRADPRVYNRPPKTDREQRFEEKLRRLRCDDEQIAFWRMKIAATNLQQTLKDYPPDFNAAFEEGTEKWFEGEQIDWLRTKIDREPMLWPLECNGRRHGHLRVYRAPQPGIAYLVIIDPSGGTGGDEAAIKVMELRSGDDVASWHGNRTKPADLGHLGASVGRYFNNATMVVERNDWQGGNGEGRETLLVLERDERYRRIYEHDDGKPGWHTNGKTRPILLQDLHKMIADELVWTPDARTVEEAASMVDDDGKIRAKGKGKPGGSDDGLFMAWGIGHQVRQRIPLGRGGAKSFGELESAGFQT